jgi:hypothetical protein
MLDCEVLQDSNMYLVHYYFSYTKNLMINKLVKLNNKWMHRMSDLRSGLVVLLQLTCSKILNFLFPFQGPVPLSIKGGR